MSLTLAGFRAELTDELLALWRASFEHGVGITDPHPMAEQRAFFVAEVLPTHEVRIALSDGRLTGFIAATPESVNQLYVRVDCLGCGIGTRLLDWAKGQSVGRLWLYTFARNLRARRFYERRGFVGVAHGFEPHWKLDDVRYEWERP